MTAPDGGALQLVTLIPVTKAKGVKIPVTYGVVENIAVYTFKFFAFNDTVNY